MKQNCFWKAVGRVLRDDPTFVVQYDVKTACYSKAKDETPISSSALIGGGKIGLRRVVAGALIFSAVSLGFALAGLFEKK